MVILNNVVLGDFCYVSDKSVVLEAKIEKFCSIWPNIRVATGEHPSSTFVSSQPTLFSNPSYCDNFFLIKIITIKIGKLQLEMMFGFVPMSWYQMDLQ